MPIPNGPMHAAAHLLDVPTAGSPPPTWPEFELQVLTAIRDMVQREACLRMGIARLLGYEPKRSLEGIRDAVADLDARGFAEAAAQVGRCSRELGYAGSPATLANAVGDACLSFAHELQEIHARHRTEVRRLEAQLVVRSGVQASRFACEPGGGLLAPDDGLCE